MRLPTSPAPKAIANHGKPVKAGPFPCQGCRQLVWWSGALPSNADGTWHRCAS